MRIHTFQVNCSHYMAIDCKKVEEAARYRSAAAAAEALSMTVSYAATHRRVYRNCCPLAWEYLYAMENNWTLFDLDTMLRTTPKTGHVNAVRRGPKKRVTAHQKFLRLSRLICGRRCSLCQVAIPEGACRLCCLLRSFHGYKTRKV